jgi:hypothetical protein
VGWRGTSLAIATIVCAGGVGLREAGPAFPTQSPMVRRERQRLV